MIAELVDEYREEHPELQSAEVEQALQVARRLTSTGSQPPGVAIAIAIAIGLALLFAGLVAYFVSAGARAPGAGGPPYIVLAAVVVIGIAAVGIAAIRRR